MLTILRIKNLALVADLTLELEPGYNAITGETGAGKSILIGALNLALGERADRTLIRSGADGCAVEATFDLRGSSLPVESFLSENGLEPCEEGLLILKRTMTVAGANRQFINGSPATLSALTTLGNWLVDIHGPHDHQSLLRPAQQLDLLDSYGKLQPLRQTFARTARRLAEIDAAKSALIIDDNTYARRLELLRHQVAEIDAARLQPDEEESLQAEFHRASNAARILELGQAGLRQLAEDDASLLNAMGGLGRTLLEMKRLDAAAESLVASHEQSLALLRDLNSDLDRYVEKLTLDPERLQQLEERLHVLQSLKHKYGHTLADVLVFGENAARELRSLEDRESELARLDGERQSVLAELGRRGRATHRGPAPGHSRSAEADHRATDPSGISAQSFRSQLEPGGPDHAGTRAAAFRHRLRPRRLPVCAEPGRATTSAACHRFLGRNGPGDVGDQDGARGAGCRAGSGLRRGGCQYRR